MVCGLPLSECLNHRRLLPLAYHGGYPVCCQGGRPDIPYAQHLTGLPEVPPQWGVQVTAFVTPFGLFEFTWTSTERWRALQQGCSWCRGAGWPGVQVLHGWYIGQLQDLQRTPAATQTDLPVLQRSWPADQAEENEALQAVCGFFESESLGGRDATYGGGNQEDHGVALPGEAQGHGSVPWVCAVLCTIPANLLRALSAPEQDQVKEEAGLDRGDGGELHQDQGGIPGSVWTSGVGQGNHDIPWCCRWTSPKHTMES